MKYEPRYVKQPGFLTDLLFIYVVHYNINETNFRDALSKDKEDITFYNEIDAHFGIMDEMFLPFFDRKENGRNFSTAAFIDKNEFYNDYSFEDMVSYFSNAEQVKEDLFEFYFGDKQVDSSDAMQCILDSDYTAEQKLQLFAFFTNPQKILSKFVEDLWRVNLLLEQYYEEHSADIATAGKIKWSKLEFDLKRVPGRTANISNAQSIIFSICLIRRNYVLYNPGIVKQTLLLGSNHKSYLMELIAQDSRYSIQTFCKALSDLHRANVYELLLQEDEMTTSEISAAMGLSITALMHHLDIMVRANVLQFRTVGRSVIYSLDTCHIQSIGEDFVKQMKRKRGNYDEKLG